jgi:F-type H+-transporting ATPase subunit b
MSAYIAELVGFALFIGLIIWQIVPRVVPIIDRRRETIRASIEGAASIREAAENERDRRKQMLEEAHTEAAAIIEQAREAAARVADDARRKVAEDTERIRHDAEVEIELRAQRAREEVAAEIRAIVVAAAEQVVLAEVDAELQHRLVAEVISAAEVATVAS